MHLIRFKKYDKIFRQNVNSVSSNSMSRKRDELKKELFNLQVESREEAEAQRFDGLANTPVSLGHQFFQLN